jgi:hypothetical protein
MRLLIDEDTAVQFVEPLRHVLLGHDVAHVSGLSWKGKKDLRVLPGRQERWISCLNHARPRSVQRPRECDAIKKSGLHHIRYTQRQEGMRGLALAMAPL